MSPRNVQDRFDRAADTFDSADFIHATTRDGLLSRLEPMSIDVKTVLDLGSATGSSGRVLARTFKRSRVIHVDLSLPMLRRASGRSGWLSKRAAVQAAAEYLPFADRSVDLVFSNLLLPWVHDPALVFAEVSRVLRKDGLFLFSTLGPDSLAGLRHEPFADMHDVGDALVRARLSDPVLDVDRLTVTYESAESLRDDLEAMGAGICFPGQVDNLNLELELIYGHSWGAGASPNAGEFAVDAATIGRRRL